MRDTKEAILTAALRLFARDGYEAVSVSQIAGELGMTKSALYRHYQNKRDIFEQILARMERMDAEQAGNFDLPEGSFEEMGEQYSTVTMERFVAYSKAQFRYWTENPFASDFRKMLTLEQFRSGEMQRLYQQYLAAGPVQYVTDLFRAMGLPEPEQRAASFYAAMFLSYSMYDGAVDPAAVTERLDSLLEHLAVQNQNKEEPI